MDFGFGIMEKIVETKKTMITRILHYNMALFGGFLACYAVMLRADFLGNAQTSNLLYLVVALVGKDFNQFILRLFAVILYVFAAVFYVFIKKKTNYNVKYISIIINFFALIVLSVIPQEINNIVALYPIFFAMSFQWNAFPGEYGYASSTIFSTNNIRQVSVSFAEYFIDKDKKMLHKALFFLGTIVFFHIGIVVGYFSVKAFYIRASLVNLIFLCPALALTYAECHCMKHKRVNKILVKNNNEGNYAKINCNNV